jgi:hypothetical protein
MKSKLQNRLAGHLDIAIYMFVETYPFQVVIMDLSDGDKVRIGMNA